MIYVFYFINIIFIYIFKAVLNYLKYWSLEGSKRLERLPSERKVHASEVCRSMSRRRASRTLIENERPTLIGVSKVRYWSHRPSGTRKSRKVSNTLPPSSTLELANFIQINLFSNFLNFCLITKIIHTKKKIYTKI